jgi:predicted permease
MSWLEGSRARLRLLFKRGAAESRADEEFRFHLDMEADRLVREAGLSRDEAHRRALATFGGVQNHRESIRDGHGFAWLGGLSLDLKLGFRMLVKYPGLTIVGGFAMAFGIWFGAVTFQMWNVVTTTKLPLPDGDRIVRIQDWDTRALHDEDRVLYDYQIWRSARSITDLGAYHDASVNLVGADGGALPVRTAEVTASAFRIAPERPLLGRVLQESDARAGADPVVLLGYDVWSSRFNSDPRIVGRTVKIGNGFATVVGVMPRGFAFPVSHEMWLPLRTSVAGVEPGRGAAVKVFGRLAHGMSIENAQAEFAAIGKRLAAEHPAAYAQIRPYVTPYAQMSLNNTDTMGLMTLSNIFVVALMVVVCSTVALLLFARAASRETEILVRSALGASRRRIVMQLFAEALVLAGVAAVVGLAGAQLALTRLGGPYLEMNYGVLPFWMNFNLSPTTILYALALSVIGAVVAGVMPARKITRRLGSQLRVGAGGGERVSFGGVWTAVIVTQVALTVALPSVVMLVRGESKRVDAYDAGFPTQDYLGVTLGLDDGLEETVTPEATAAARARIGTSLEALRTRLEAEPGVLGVTFVDALPAEDHSAFRAELVSLPGTAASWVRTASIDPGYFSVLQAPVLSGRAFTSADLGSDVHVAIVDKGFVDLVMNGRNPVGHRVRLQPSQMDDSTAAKLPLYEIVGVVKELGIASAAMPQRAAGLYLPAEPGSQGADKMIVRTRGDPLSLVPRIRDLTASVDPSLRVETVTRLDRVTTPLLWLLQLWERIIICLTGVALVLSLAGIYAVLSYIVARRTREIGVRVALGASARRVISSIFRRPLTQVSLGVVAGAVFIGVAAYAIQLTTQFHVDQPRGLTLGQTALLVGYAMVMLGVCTLACVVPTRRALRVQPTEALRAE